MADFDRPLRAELELLLIVEKDERAIGWNAGVREAIRVVDHHELDRQERSAEALAKRKAMGKKIGGDVPYGYELALDGETLRKSASEQKVIATAKRLREAGHSLRTIARRLKEQNMTPREGDEFYAAQVKRMLEEKR